MNCWRVIGGVAPLVLWFVCADVFVVAPEEYLPSIRAVFRALRQSLTEGILLSDAQSTLYRWLSGFLIGSTLGVLIGFLISQSKLLRALCDFPIEFFRALPVTALLPVFFLVFGVGDESKIAMACFPSFLLLAVYTEGGVKHCSAERIETLRVLDANGPQILYYLIIPETLPSLLLGLRLALSLSLVVSIIAEMFIGTELGLGQRVYESYMMNSVAALYANIFAIGLMGYGASLLLQILEHRSLYWVGQ